MPIYNPPSQDLHIPDRADEADDSDGDEENIVDDLPTGRASNAEDALYGVADGRNISQHAPWDRIKREP